MTRAAVVAAVPLVLLVLCASRAHAEVDWATGFVSAKALGVADRHAPSPASAREPARRAAEESARKLIAAQLAALPLASGGTLATRLADPAVKTRIDRALASAITLASTPHTDGSWELTLGLPLEAVRLALTGPRKRTGADTDPPVIVVEGVAAKPAIGITVGGVAAATLWLKDAPAWTKGAPRVKATGAKSGAIELAAKQGGPSTLYVLVTK